MQVNAKSTPQTVCQWFTFYWTLYWYNVQFAKITALSTITSEMVAVQTAMWTSLSALHTLLTVHFRIVNVAYKY